MVATEVVVTKLQIKKLFDKFLNYCRFSNTFVYNELIVSLSAFQNKHCNKFLQPSFL